MVNDEKIVKYEWFNWEIKIIACFSEWCAYNNRNGSRKQHEGETDARILFKSRW